MCFITVLFDCAVQMQAWLVVILAICFAVYWHSFMTFKEDPLQQSCRWQSSQSDVAVTIREKHSIVEIMCSLQQSCPSHSLNQRSLWKYWIHMRFSEVSIALSWPEVVVRVWETHFTLKPFRFLISFGCFRLTWAGPGRTGREASLCQSHIADQQLLHKLR